MTKKISFWGIEHTKAIIKKDAIFKYILCVSYRSEPFITQSYMIKNTDSRMRYIPIKSLDRIHASTEIKYMDCDYFIDDIKFLKDWDIDIDINPDDSRYIESHSDRNAVRMVC